jgi:hypothetical protein
MSIGELSLIVEVGGTLKKVARLLVLDSDLSELLVVIVVLVGGLLGDFLLLGRRVVIGRSWGSALGGLGSLRSGGLLGSAGRGDAAASAGVAFELALDVAEGHGGGVAAAVACELGKLVKVDLEDC